MKNLISNFNTFCRVKRTYPSLLLKQKQKKHLPDNFILGMTDQESDFKSR